MISVSLENRSNSAAKKNNSSVKTVICIFVILYILLKSISLDVDYRENALKCRMKMNKSKLFKYILLQLLFCRVEQLQLFTRIVN